MIRPLFKQQVLWALLLTGGVALSSLLVGCAKGSEPSGDKDKPASAAKAKAAAKYYCPMHPTYTSPKPGVCPICNMNLVPLEAHEDHSSHDPAMKPTDAQTVCLRHECPMIKAGENCPMLIVSGTGETPSCPVCSKRIAESELTPVAHDGVEGYAAVSLSPAKRQLIGVRTARVGIRDLDTSIRTAGIALTSPEINLFVYESDLPRISETSRVKAFFPALGRELEGKVSRIPLSLDRGLSPSTIGAGAVLNAGSSQITLRARLEDPERVMRRGMTADVEVLTGLGAVTALPEAAVFFTGKRAMVFVERAEAGVYEPREVALGERADGYYAVRSGVKDGETVVTSGNFLIDSESRLRSALQGMAGGDGGTGEVIGTGKTQGTGEAPGHVH
jgi:Cu(I)/Ag(I) efflux system membrane fusion protein